MWVLIIFYAIYDKMIKLDNFFIKNNNFVNFFFFLVETIEKNVFDFFQMNTSKT